MNLLRRGAVLFYLSGVVFQPARAQDIGESGIKDREGAVKFCKDLQLAVKDGDSRKIASWINAYPIEVRRGDKNVLVIDDDDFVRKFFLIIDPATRDNLLSSNACNLPLYSQGPVKIAESKIEIDQGNGSSTFISSIAPPPDADSAFMDNSEYESGAATFFKELQKAISAGDRRAVANMCEYSLSVNVGGRQRDIHNRSELIAQYPSIFDSEVKRAVLSLAKPIHAGWRGFMTGQGELWLDLVVGTHVFRVRTVNGGTPRSKKGTKKESNASPE